MTIKDLTWNFVGERFAPQITKENLLLQSGHTKYTGVVFTLHCDGMSGTYIDFPGHIAETDDGMTAENASLEDFYRIEADVIHLDKKSGEGAVTGEELEKALSPSPAAGGRALILNALGNKNPRDIEGRSVFLDESALDWIMGKGYKLLVSDIYESKALHGVFLKLFAAGISTICMPVNLFTLPRRVFLTALFPKIPGVTQLPCRVVAEF
ncbi:MAG: cyclase family protein [Lentisphaeria bacterium]|nr:cyclase family protein [Lentisphaeria bacterium]